jgi:ubiquinone/menaquinone biosynthesis C-methylase UbiE
MNQADAMKHQAKRQFETWATRYDRSPLNRLLFEPAWQVLLEELYLWRGDAIGSFDLLDVGSGTGTFAARVVGSSLDVRAVGLDFAPAMSGVAHEKACQSPWAGQLRFVTGDAEHLPFPPDSFDAVTCSNSFHHYPNQQQVVREIRRVLRPGGRLMLIDGFRDNVVGWFVFDVIAARVEKAVFHAPWSTIHDYFTAAGFSDIRRRKLNLWLPLLLTVGTA